MVFGQFRGKEKKIKVMNSDPMLAMLLLRYV